MRFRAVSTAVPEWRVGNAEISAWTGLELPFLDNKIGVRSRAFLKPDEPPSSLAIAAGRTLFAEHPECRPQDIEFLIVVTQNGDHVLPHTSAIVQHALGVPQTAACFDVNLGCSGFVYALSVARGLGCSEGFKNGLIVTCDPYSKVMDRNDRNVTGLFGDAAAAVWISDAAGGEIGLTDFGTDGGRAGALIVRREARTPLQPEGWQESAPAQPVAAKLAMDGRAIFNFMMTAVPGTLQRCLARNGLAQADISWFVFHQASRFMLEKLSEQLRLPPERVPIEMGDTGNTVSSSIPFALKALLERQGPAPGRVLVSGFGVGLSWATSVLDFGDPR